MGLPSSSTTYAGASAPKAPHYTVAICSRNRADSLEKAARSVLPQLGDDAELLLVDNDSTDATPSVMTALAAADPRVRITRQPRRGIAAARNQALAEARGPFVAFLDDDELAFPDWLDAVREFARRHPDDTWAAVGGPYLSAPEIPLPDWIEPNYGKFDHGGEERILPAPLSLAGGNFVVRRDDALAAAGFDESLPRHEDSALSAQLRAAGHAVWWLPAARVRHLIPANRLTFAAQRRLWFAEGVASVPFRLREVRGGFRRCGALLFRALVIPAQATLQGLGAGFRLLAGDKRAAARLFLRACRGAGVGCESIRWLAAGRFRMKSRP